MNDPPVSGEATARGIGDDLARGQNAVLEGQTISSLVADKVTSG
jgi:hypothetical protein